jgi:hypothetical protein
MVIDEGRVSSVFSIQGISQLPRIGHVVAFDTRHPSCWMYQFIAAKLKQLHTLWDVEFTVKDQSKDAGSPDKSTTQH